MEFKIFNIFFSLLIFIRCYAIIFEKPLYKFNKNEITQNNIDKRIQRNLVDDSYLYYILVKIVLILLVFIFISEII